MPDALQEIYIKPAKSGTALITVSLVDTAGDTVTFRQLTNPQWQLMTVDGKALAGYTFANSSLTALSWVLNGSALAMSSLKDSGERILTFKATYNSTYGNNLPIHVSCTFFIQNIAGIDYEEFGYGHDLTFSDVKVNSNSGFGGL